MLCGGHQVVPQEPRRSAASAISSTAIRMCRSQWSRASGVTANGRVPHPQPRVPALVGVGVRPAPVLLQEHQQPLVRWPEILLGVQRAEQVVAGDPVVEDGHEPLEGRASTHPVVRRELAGGVGVGHALIVADHAHHPVGSMDLERSRPTYF